MKRTGLGLRGAVAAMLATACSSSATDPTKAPCDHYFEALLRCQLALTPPADEVARREGRYEKSCAAMLALAGSNTTTAWLDGCASAVQASGCGALYESAACQVVPGSLPPGAGCEDPSQCQSGQCTAGGAACGTCAAATPVGQACGASGAQCVAGSVCTAGTCVPVTYGAAGAPCGSGGAACGAGLYCAQTCMPAGGEGAACSQPSACASPYVCAGLPNGTCQSPGVQGASCMSDFDCAVPLGCNNMTCGPVTWVDGGQPCGGAARCLVGVCPSAGTSPSGQVCPLVIADGQACDPTDSTTTCDAYARCVSSSDAGGGGTCVLSDTTACM